MVITLSIPTYVGYYEGQLQLGWPWKCDPWISDGLIKKWQSSDPWKCDVSLITQSRVFTGGCPLLVSSPFPLPFLIHIKSRFFGILEVFTVLFTVDLLWPKSEAYSKDTRHNSPNDDKYQTQSAKVLALLWKQAHQDDWKDTPQPIVECQVSFLLLRIKP